ncbi:hypothetical protein B0T14DRAFT_497657 [Immersiella caudata]|uniref:Uncharacterized protein n=1 Tax=Immersiella caudata TaxID=314043 RepID=A0AA40BWM1_9PEZI|nr:hypothetical protein B0T14DRAFT_497657 [Immersiella caudata]
MVSLPQDQKTTDDAERGFPKEVLDKIVDLTPNSNDGKPHHYALANVSSAFRSSVERNTFRQFVVHHWPQTNQTAWRSLLEYLTVQPERLACLRALHFSIHLQCYFEQVAMDELPGFSGSLESVDMANDYTQEGVSEAEFERVRTPQYLLEQTLDLLRSRPSDQVLSSLELCITHLAGESSFNDHRDPVVIFELNDALRELTTRIDPVPGIKQIASLHDLASGSECLIALSGKLPSLESIAWRFPEINLRKALPQCARQYPFTPYWQRALRPRFTRALEQFKMPESTKSLDLHIGPMNDWFPSHDLPLADMLGPATEDPFCLALHKTIDDSNLETVTYSGPVHPSLFWPSFRQDNDESVWPKVQHIAIRFPMHGDPSGRWYFDRPEDPAPTDLQGFAIPSSEQAQDFSDPDRIAAQGSGDTPIGYQDPDELAVLAEHIDEAFVWARDFQHLLDFVPIYDRDQPSEKTLKPLLEAFALLLASMPELRSAVLSTRLPPNGETALAVLYVGAGEEVAAEEKIPLHDRVTDKSLPRVYLALDEWYPGWEAGGRRRYLNFYHLFSAIGWGRYQQSATVKTIRYITELDPSDQSLKAGF